MPLVNTVKMIFYSLRMKKKLMKTETPLIHSTRIDLVREFSSIHLIGFNSKISSPSFI